LIIFSHTGVQDYAFDFGLNITSIVVAASDGIVTFIRTYSTLYGCCNEDCIDYAQFVTIQHSRVASTYWHLNEVMVTVGQSVIEGDVIGKSGETGFACGPHLHFQIQQPDVFFGQSVPVCFDKSGYNYILQQGQLINP